VANLKRLEQLSGWLTYELETTLLDPPVLKVRLRPMDNYDAAQGRDVWRSSSRAMLEVALAAVAEWDLTENGVPIPFPSDPAIKAAALRPLMSEKVVGRDSILGTAIFTDSLDRGLFLKN
jgi:hypothetical protein